MTLAKKASAAAGLVLGTAALLIMAGSANAGDSLDRINLHSVDHQTQISYSRMRYNRRTGNLHVTTTVTNTSISPLSERLVYVVNSITSPNVSVQNADGQVTPDNAPYLDLNIPLLNPGQSTSFELIFNAPTRERFNLDASIYQVTEGPFVRV